MKKVLKPAEQEDSVYYSDFSGKCFGNFYPDVTFKMEFNYGSKYDGAAVEFHVSDDEADAILEFLKSKVSDDCKEGFREKLHKQSKNLEDAIDARDYTQSEFYSSSCNLLKFLTK